ncbi:AAA family ATPase [Actinoplanes sp. TRM 88003]|uniref:AAA family ATPase n=1 Tax=Paractinoplanes aksuensis TaxID=2939490 RepID=A0ABT1DZB6_9ACTN|nr:LuxR family transcriptional regulator [Actinoplanes aksuensis]MCO8276224.1 AAA family ATPase [Actinoplanes aksuensis]
MAQPTPAASGLVGRRAERDALERLLTAARGGRSGAVVVRGEAGIGKTALLDLARGLATGSGFRVESATGVEAETQFAYAGLHQLCEPLLDRTAALPEPQRTALEVAFGRRSGAAPDRFLVGLATLSLLATVAEEGPLLCLVDDAHWLDPASAQVLTFVARRVTAERLALVFTQREPCAGLPELHLDGLGEADARTLLNSAVNAPLDDRVRDRIVDEARGNPLALLELPRNVPPARLAGGFERPDVVSVPRRVESSFQSRSGCLPAGTQLLLLTAAAEPTGDVALLWRAAAELGLDRAAADPAEAAGLLEIGRRVLFRHPLVRSAVYRAASWPDRRRAHGALAAATDPHADPDRRAWHRAQAVLGADEQVAAELERSAGRACARGGSAAAAAFLQQAAELTPEPTQRARRALAAAHAKHETGAFEAARELLTTAAAGPLDALARARLELLRAQLEAQLNRGREATGMLLDAARTLGPLDPALARETYLQAFEASVESGRLADDHGWLAAARTAPPPPGSPRAADLLLDGLTTRFLQGYVAAVPPLRKALEMLRMDGDRRWLGLAGHIALMLWDDEAIHALAEVMPAAAIPPYEHDGSADGSLALPELIEAAVRAGQHERAAAALEQLSLRARASGTPWALGLEARSRALLTSGPAAEKHYREAVDHLEHCRVAIDLARARLVYGEWLRREGRRHDAREQLRLAHELLSGLGAEAFAERAARELRATGEHPRRRTAGPADDLTAHELHIAQLVATGATSQEVAAQLFLSPRTIESHLRKIFRKLGITSRRQLKDLRLVPRSGNQPVS